jgi:rare lipoprotein A
MIRAALLLASLAVLSSCGLSPRSPTVGLHYQLGAPYQTGGVWRYPRESFDYDDTGIASVATRGRGLTADGETFDQTALAAGDRTLQLPAIARITNLENGRSVVVRVNDRGPADPARLIEVTRRTAQLLAAANPAAFRVRVQVLPEQRRAVLADLPGAAPPLLAVARAQTGNVEAQTLAPPPGAASIAGRRAAAGPHVVASATAVPVQVPLRMPERVTQGMAKPGVLAVDLADFDNARAASVMASRFVRLGPRVATSYYAPRDVAYMVRLGPFTTLPQAEAALHRALQAGAAGARIVVE